MAWVPLFHPTRGTTPTRRTLTRGPRRSAHPRDAAWRDSRGEWSWSSRGQQRLRAWSMGGTRSRECRLVQVLHEQLAVSDRRGVQLDVRAFVILAIEPLVEEERLRVAGTDHEQLVAAGQRRMGQRWSTDDRAGRRDGMQRTGEQQEAQKPCMSVGLNRSARGNVQCLPADGRRARGAPR